MSYITHINLVKENIVSIKFNRYVDYILARLINNNNIIERYPVLNDSVKVYMQLYGAHYEFIVQEAGSYVWSLTQPQNVILTECPKNAYCGEYGQLYGSIQPKTGYWKANWSNPFQNTFGKCIFEERCLNNGCVKGFDNYKCLGCSKGYYFVSKYCSICPSYYFSIFQICAIFLINVIFWFLVYNYSQKFNSCWKMILLTFQSISILSKHNIEYPFGIRIFLDIVGYITLFGEGKLPLSCLNFTKYMYFMTIYLVPIFILLVYGFYLIKEGGYKMSLFMNHIFYLCSPIYIIMFISMFSKTEELGNKSFWSYDVSIEYDIEHIYWILKIGIVMGLSIIFMISVMYYQILKADNYDKRVLIDGYEKIKYNDIIELLFFIIYCYSIIILKSFTYTGIIVLLYTFLITYLKVYSAMEHFQLKLISNYLQIFNISCCVFYKYQLISSFIFTTFFYISILMYFLYISYAIFKTSDNIKLRDYRRSVMMSRF
tara:strand:- start:1594 stop:3051 length:1458 start_codon:yes stop_codon:yes gene_type:complete